MTAIHTHTCRHKYQDEKYGAGMRVFNLKKKGKASNIQDARCTVCSGVITL